VITMTALAELSPAARAAASVRGAATTSDAPESLAVEFHDVGRAFPTADGPRTVLRDITLTVEPGEVLAILGASGCGKSTLLRAAGGLDTGNSGEILIGGEPVTTYDPRTAVGFQEPRLMPWRTLHQNVALGLPHGTGRTEGRERVDRLLELVGLDAHAGHRPWPGAPACCCWTNRSAPSTP
jgi:sulfonate transport system ATP-binding protein